MRFIFAFLLVQAIVFEVYAQDRFAPGYYVTNEQDTTRGFIEFRTNYNNGFKFRSHVNSKNEQVAIEKASAFGFESGDTFARVSYSPQPEVAKTSVYTRVIVEGGMDLYRYKGRFLIGNEEKGRHTLEEGKTSNSSEGLKKYQKNTGIFNILMQDCAAAKEDAQRVPISSESLTLLVRKYNACRSLPNKEFPVIKRDNSNSIGFFAGWNMDALSFSYSSKSEIVEGSFLSNSKFGKSSGPTFGIIGLVGGRKQSSVFSFQGELAYTKGEYSGSNARTNSVGGFDIEQSTATAIKYSKLVLRVGLRLTARSNRINPYLALGLGHAIFISSSIKSHVITRINSQVEEEDVESDMGNLRLPVWISAGVKKRVLGKKAVFVDINHENTGIDYGGRISSTSFRIGLLF